MAYCHLLSYPNEIVLRFVDELFPENLVPFILTNKAIKQVSEHALRNHKALMKKHSLIRFGDPASPAHEQVLTDLLENDTAFQQPREEGRSYGLLTYLTASIRVLRLVREI